MGRYGRNSGGIEFVRFRDLLIEDVRIAAVSTSAWLNAYWRSSDSRSFAGAWSPDLAEVAESEILDRGLRSDALHRVSRPL